MTIHCLPPGPRSPHQGGTRPARIEEFLAENDVPVLGLREGAWLQVSGTRAHLSGRNTGRLFRRHTDPIDIPAGADLSDLLNTRPRFDIGTTAWAGSRRCPGRRCGPSLAGPGLVRQRSADPCSTRHLVRDSL